MPVVEFRTLGGLDLRAADGRELHSLLAQPKRVALLAYLCIAEPRGFHRRDTLLGLFWPDSDQDHARASLRKALHILRRALGEDSILARGDEEVAIDFQRVTCDVVAFEASLRAGRIEEALEIYRGDLVPGFFVDDAPEFERWLNSERARLRTRAAEAAHACSERNERKGDLDGALKYARRSLEICDTDERVLRRVVDLQDRAGDRSGALDAYETFAQRLESDYEAKPASDTRLLIDQIRLGRDALPPIAPPSAVIPIGSAENSPGTDKISPPTFRAPAFPSKRVAALLAVFVGSLLVAGWLVFLTPSAAGRTADSREPKRIVVIPFSNLGLAEDAYFTDGYTEEVAARLAAVDRFRVTGNSSANRYRNTKKSVQEIGRDLGVDFVLEGTVRWQKSSSGPARVRVTQQLVSTKDGTTLWAHVYDEPLDEIFRVQSEIAQKVVSALDVRLLASEQRVVSDTPTRNLAAYDYYLRGMDYRRRGNSDVNSRAAQLMLEKAVALDPQFALAYANLSRTHTLMYWNSLDHTPERLAQARSTAERALELEPGLPNAHGALAIYYGLGVQEYDSAMREFAVAEVAGHDAFIGRATVLFRQGKIRESLPYYERARQQDPASSTMYSNSGQPYAMLGEYAKAEQLFDRAIALAPDRANGYLFQFWNYLRWDGNTRRARPVMEAAQAARVMNQPGVVYGQVLMEIFDRRYDTALSLLSSDAAEITLSDHLRVVPRAQLYAFVYALQHRPALAKAYYDSSRRILLKKIQQDPEDPRLRTALGIAYAGVGRKQEAIREGLKAKEIVPISKELMKGYHTEWEVARIYTMVGEHGLAINRLEYLLSIPGHLSEAWLRMDPVWDPLRGNPRFQKLVAQVK
jgi:serine/threonine-protein kinase